MNNLFAAKSPAIQDVIARLMRDLGPDRVAVCSDIACDAESIAIALRADSSRMVFITTAGAEQGRYTVSYDELHTTRGGKTTIEGVTAEGVVYEGLCWISRKIFEHGVVMSGFDIRWRKSRGVRK